MTDLTASLTDIADVAALPCPACANRHWVACNCISAGRDSRSCLDCRGGKEIPCGQCDRGKELRSVMFAPLVKPQTGGKVLDGWTI